MDDYFDIGLEHKDPAVRALIVETTKRHQNKNLGEAKTCKFSKITLEDYLKFVEVANEHGNWVQNHSQMVSLIETLIVNHVTPDRLDSSIPPTLIGFGLKPAFEMILTKYG